MGAVAPGWLPPKEALLARGGRVFGRQGLLADATVTTVVAPPAISPSEVYPAMRSAQRLFSLLPAVCLLGVLGCAHETPVVQAASAPPPPVVAKAEAPPAAATDAQKEDAAALGRLLTGPIAYF